MEIKTLTQGSATIIEISGAIDSNTAPVAQETLIPLTVNKCSFVMDLSKCTYISSAGLRVLLMLAKQCASLEGSLALSGLCDEIKDVMEMTGFSGFFNIHKTVPEAVESLKKGA